MSLFDTENVFVVDEVYDEMVLSRQQIHAGNQIIKCFREDPNGIRWVVLLAQMQSGKTETYLFVCCELIRLELVKEVVIFSGNAETDLRDQLKTEAYEDYELGKKIDKTPKFFSKYNIYLEETLGLTTRARTPIVNNIKASIKVLWGTELNKYEKSHRDTLFVWEEAHHAQTINQCPFKFLKKIGITGDGNTNRLRKKRNFVVSISATPFSEISDIYHMEQNKKIVYMRPGDGYTSVEDILTSGRLKSFSSVESGLTSALNLPHDSPKYAVVRVSNKNEENVKRIITSNGWGFVVFDSISTGYAKILGEETWKGMKNAPKKDTVILLKGKCRMGKNLDKEHVLFVMETSKTSNTDTVLQGLLGRACGYKFSDKVYVYLHQKIVNSGEIQRYIDLTKGQERIPSKGCNLSKTSIVKTKHPIVPFLVKNINVDTFSRKRIIKKVCKAINDTEFDFGNTDPDQFREMVYKLNEGKPKFEIEVHDVTQDLTEVDPAKVKKWKDISQAFRHFRSTGINLPHSLWHTGIEKVKKDGTKLEEGRIVHIFYYKERNEQYGIAAGSAFVYGVTETINPIYVAKTNIPTTTGREVFASRKEDDVEEVSNGGFTINMPVETARDVDAMKHWILRFVKLSIEFPHSRSINSQWDAANNEWKGILVKSSVEESLQPGGEIYNAVLEQGFELKLTRSTKVSSTTSSLGFVKYASISW